MSVLVSGVWEWQSRNWDPALVGTPYFEYYCGNLTSDKLLYPSLNSSTKEVQKLLTKGGYGSQLKSLTIPYLNWIGWLTGKISSSPYCISYSLYKRLTIFQTTQQSITAIAPPIKIPATQPTISPTTHKTMPHKTGVSGPTNTAPNGDSSKMAHRSPPTNYPSSPAPSISHTPQSSAKPHSTSPHPPTWKESTNTADSPSATHVSPMSTVNKTRGVQPRHMHPPSTPQPTTVPPPPPNPSC